MQASTKAFTGKCTRAQVDREDKGTVATPRANHKSLRREIINSHAKNISFRPKNPACSPGFRVPPPPAVHELDAEAPKNLGSAPRGGRALDELNLPKASEAFLAHPPFHPLPRAAAEGDSNDSLSDDSTPRVLLPLEERMAARGYERPKQLSELEIRWSMVSEEDRPDDYQVVYAAAGEGGQSPGSEKEGRGAGQASCGGGYTVELEDDEPGIEPDGAPPEPGGGPPDIMSFGCVTGFAHAPNPTTPPASPPSFPPSFPTGYARQGGGAAAEPDSPENPPPFLSAERYSGRYSGHYSGRYSGRASDPAGDTNARDDCEPDDDPPPLRGQPPPQPPPQPQPPRPSEPLGSPPTPAAQSLSEPMSPFEPEGSPPQVRGAPLSCVDEKGAAHSPRRGLAVSTCPEDLPPEAPIPPPTPEASPSPTQPKLPPIWGPNGPPSPRVERDAPLMPRRVGGELRIARAGFEPSEPPPPLPGSSVGNAAQ
eukprot:CAMPEP_0172636118 /NCGR_PEP_ID=MMETSP1068-20121228/202437_1 /TAXON_ID=35684 /ORGANISM="Pseudopedinella elastica, Strain CCMP716" /LENGTH=480 /DNA_ID=CAMNT_0013448481 /DNA_START=128 /DNA_END=1571 /DNA_ORIENTATION=-